MTLEAFAAVFVRLALQLRAEADAPTIQAYYTALHDVDLELLVMAAEEFARTPRPDGGPWFPPTPEWRERAQVIEQRRTAELRDRIRSQRVPLCAICGDTGFARDDQTNTVTPCGCRAVRRDEILGRRPMPALPPGVLVPEASIVSDGEARAMREDIERRLKTAIVIKTMPHATRRRVEKQQNREALRRAAALMKQLTAKPDASES
jgi:hypothetical protein